MLDQFIDMTRHCRNCLAPLTIEEMHYFDSGNGTATCSKCEEKWAAEMAAWRSTDSTPMPKRP